MHRRLQQKLGKNRMNLKKHLPAMDDVTRLSEEPVPCMPSHAPRTKLLFLAKSDCVRNLLEIQHGGQTIVSFGIHPGDRPKKRAGKRLLAT